MKGFVAWFFSMLSRRTHAIDWPLMTALLALQLISLVILASAGGDDQRLMWSQAARFAAGLIALAVLSNISPIKIRQWSPLIFIASIFLMLLVFAFGSGRSANLWLNLGVVYVQPGELLKLSVPMMLTWYLHQKVLRKKP